MDSIPWMLESVSHKIWIYDQCARSGGGASVHTLKYQKYIKNFTCPRFLERSYVGDSLYHE